MSVRAERAPSVAIPGAGSSGAFFKAAVDLGLAVDTAADPQPENCDALLLCAPAYPAVTPLSAAARQSMELFLAAGKAVYLEYAPLAGLVGEVRGNAVFERLLVTGAGQHTNDLPMLTVLEEHSSYYLPLLDGQGSVWLSYAKVAGVDRAVFGAPAERVPALIERIQGAGRLLIATTALSNWERGRYRPTASWQALLRAVLLGLLPEQEAAAIRDSYVDVQAWTEPRQWVAPGEAVCIQVRTTPGSTVQVSGAAGVVDLQPLTNGVFVSESFTPELGAHQWQIQASRGGTLRETTLELTVAPRAQRYLETVERNLLWFERAGMLVKEDGSKGVREGFRSQVKPDGKPSVAGGIRVDCVSECALAFRTYGLLTGNETWLQRGNRMLEYTASSFICTSRDGWYFGQWQSRNEFRDDGGTLYVFNDDSGAGSFFTLLGYASTGDLEQLRTGLRGVEYFTHVASEETGLFRRMNHREYKGSGRMGTPWPTMRAMNPTSDKPHKANLIQASLLAAYLLTGEPRYLEIGERGIRTLMELYPNWPIQTSRTCEHSRMLLPLILLQQAVPTAEHRGWIDTVVDYLAEKQAPCGALIEWDGINPKSNAAFGTGETSIFQQNGDTITDQLYNSGFALYHLGLAYQLTGDERIGQIYRRLGDYLCRIQIEDPDPLYDGTWMRAFDYGRWEYFGSSADIGWGPYCVETGWQCAPLIMGLMLELETNTSGRVLALPESPDPQLLSMAQDAKQTADEIEAALIRSQTVIYVTPDGADGNSGNSWAEAKASIQAAVEAAGADGTVLVTNGVYDTGNYENTRVLITNNVTLRSVVPHGAVIRGSGLATYDTPSAIRCVYMNSGVLDGFILEEGVTSDASKWNPGGGGLVIQSPSVMAINCVIRNCKAWRGGGVHYGTLRDCVVTNNIATDSGGGSDNGTRYNCLFSDNTALNGGGVFWGHYYDCVIRGNVAAEKGGGALGNPTYSFSLTDCVIENNRAGESGGGVYDAVLTSCAVKNNECVANGGGMFLGTAYSTLFSGNSAQNNGGTWGANLYGCTVVNNTATDGESPGIYYNSDEAVYNTVAYNNTGSQSVDLCNLTAASTVSNTLAGTANLAHPGVTSIPAGEMVFVDPAHNDFRPCPGSMAINAGDNALNPSINTLDLGGAPRICFGTVDAGAYEYKTLCVSTYGDNSNNGLSWGTAKQTIQAAVDAADNGMTVLVSNGVYNIGTRPTPVVPVVLNRLVITKGVTVKSLSGAEQSVIQGEGSYNVPGATRCVFMSAGVLDGFTLENGCTLHAGSAAASTNEYIRGGGGLCIMTPAPGTLVKNCVIRNNEASTGGGVTGGQTSRIESYVYRHNAMVVDCVITNNKAGYGGGIAYYATFDRCLIADNNATGQGGGAYDVKQGVNNSLLVRNTARTTGGVHNGKLNNCTLTENAPGGAIGAKAAHILYVNNTIAWANEEWDIKQNGFAEAVNVCTSNPLFRDAANRDYRLAIDSPCVNAGDNTRIYGALDLGGLPRIAFDTVDIGAYEFPELVRVTFDVSPGLFKATGSSVAQVLVPSTEPGYGSWLPTEEVYYARHKMVGWRELPEGAGAVIAADTPLLSFDEHVIHAQWRVAGLIINLR